MTRYGPYRWSAGGYGNDHTVQFRGAVFAVKDPTGTTFVDREMSGCRGRLDTSGSAASVLA